MTEENTNKESAEEKAGNIFSWTADTLSFIKEISKDIKQVATYAVAGKDKDFTAENADVSTHMRLYIDYIKDSFKATAKASTKPFLLADLGDKQGKTERINKEREYKPTIKDFKTSELNRLSTFVQNHFNEASPEKEKNWYSIDLGDKKYKELEEKKSGETVKETQAKIDYFNLAKSFGKVRFKIDRNDNTITFEDSYDFSEYPEQQFKVPSIDEKNFKGKLASRTARQIVGPSEAPKYQIKIPLNNSNMEPSISETYR